MHVYVFTHNCDLALVDLERETVRHQTRLYQNKVVYVIM